MMQSKRRRCLHSPACTCHEGPLTEEVLLLVFKSQKWNPFLIVSASQVCRWFSDLAKRFLWREFCLSRGPNIVFGIGGNGQVTVQGGFGIGGSGRGTVQGGWDALGKLLIYCAGCRESRKVHSKTVLGHFVQLSRFSKTSGRSFLIPDCRADTLYISDPCEHLGRNGEDDIGLFRGIFNSFLTSATRRMLIEKHVELEPKEKCPYCYTRVWSLLNAKMIPTSAHKRLGAHKDVEYFVCLNGHIHGRCSLLHLSDDEVSSDEADMNGCGD